MNKWLVFYLLMIISSVGYYSLIDNNDNFVYVWICIFVLGLVLLLINNHRFFMQSGSKIVYLDVLFTIWVIVIPIIQLPYGVSRLIMASMGTLYAVIISGKKLKTV